MSVSGRFGSWRLRELATVSSFVVANENFRDAGASRPVPPVREGAQMHSFISREHSRLALLSAGLLVCVVLAVAQPGAALGASSKGCDGGGFAVTLGDGSTL